MAEPKNQSPDGVRPGGGWAPRLRWVPALVLSVGAVAGAPWLGELRRAVQGHLGGAYADTLAYTLAGVGVLAFAGAAASIRRDRALRYGLLVFALGLVVAQVLLWQRGSREVQLVERVHLVEYGLIAFLWVNALRARFRDGALPVLALLVTAVVGLADEWVQWATPVRVGDVQDVLLNGWAGAIGVLFAMALIPPARFELRPAEPTLRAVRVAGLVVLVGAGWLFDTANQGAVIRDPVAGSFVSVYEPGELLRASEERARRWAREPPGPLRPLALEDRFLSEAGAHLAARNGALNAGRHVRAVLDNRILERWYGPYLDLPRGKGGRTARWTAERRTRIEKEAGPAVERMARTYRSGAFRERLVTVPQSLLWAVVLAAAAVWWWGVAWLMPRTAEGADRESDHGLTLQRAEGGRR